MTSGKGRRTSMMKPNHTRGGNGFIISSGVISANVR